MYRYRSVPAFSMHYPYVTLRQAGCKRPLWHGWRGAGFQPVCKYPRHRRQVLAVAVGVQASRLRHGLIHRLPSPPLRPSAFRS
ncbi:MAG: hypothetical protein KatS3mg056_0864 [Chloroflexus sp.]|jgi:hypothetical protein|nr:MAG: hypothetical protein KatS3mg056_0864 [Chloroflexus sp.]